MTRAGRNCPTAGRRVQPTSHGPPALTHTCTLTEPQLTGMGDELLVCADSSADGWPRDGYAARAFRATALELVAPELSAGRWGRVLAELLCVGRDDPTA